jgi:hypothetical protein
MCRERRLHAIQKKLVCLFDVPARNTVDVHGNLVQHRVSKAAGISQFGFGRVYVVVFKSALLDESWRQKNVQTLDRRRDAAGGLVGSLGANTGYAWLNEIPAGLAVSFLNRECSTGKYKRNLIADADPWLLKARVEKSMLHAQIRKAGHIYQTRGRALILSIAMRFQDHGFPPWIGTDDTAL